MVEEETSGYTVEISREGATFVIVNTYDKPDEPNEPGAPDEHENHDESDAPDEPGEADYPDIPDEDVPLASLPQTGLLWWPVPLLLCGGLLLIVFGLLRRRGSVG